MRLTHINQRSMSVTLSKMTIEVFMFLFRSSPPALRRGGRRFGGRGGALQQPRNFHLGEGTTPPRKASAPLLKTGGEEGKNPTSRRRRPSQAVSFTLPLPVPLPRKSHPSCTARRCPRSSLDRLGARTKVHLHVSKPGVQKAHSFRVSRPNKESVCNAPNR